MKQPHYFRSDLQSSKQVFPHLGVRSWLRHDAGGLGLVTFVLILAHIRTLTGSRSYCADDILSMHYPFLVYLRRVLHQGFFPGWCPLNLCGFPMGADGGTGCLSPFNLLLALPFTMPILYGLLTFAPYWVAAAGMYFLCRWLGRSSMASVGAALIFSLSGFMVAHLVHLTVISAAAWFPWVLYGGARFTVDRRAKWGILGAMAFSMQFLAAFPQVALYTSLALLAFIWVCQPQAALSEKGFVRRIGDLFLRPGFIVVAGICLAGVQFVPMAQLASRSIRHNRQASEFVTSYSLAPKHLITLLHPYLFGKPFELSAEIVGKPVEFERFASKLGILLETWHQRLRRSSWFDSYGTWNPWELTVFVGSLPLLAALIWSTRGPDARRVWGLWAMALGSLFLAFGHHNAIYCFLCKPPVLNSFRCPARWVLVWSAMIPLLFAFAVDHLAQGGIQNPILRGLSRWSWRIRLRHRIRVETRHFAAFIVLLSGGEVFAFAWTYNPVIPSRLFHKAPAIVRSFGPLPHQGRIETLLQGPLREAGLSSRTVDQLFRGGEYASNFNMVEGFPRAEGYHPLLLQNIADLRRHLNLAHPPQAAMLGVEFLVSNKPRQQLPRGWQPVETASGLTLYRNTRYIGLAWICHQVRPSELLYADLDSPARVKELAGSVAYVDGSFPDLSKNPPTIRPDYVRVRAWNEREILIDSESEAPGLLVITSTYYPGWRATLDGQPVQLLLCNKAFCGVKLPSGKHRVHLSYHPTGLAAGLSLTGVGVLLCGLASVLPRVPQRRGQRNK